jgi:hypothetical protein
VFCVNIQGMFIKETQQNLCSLVNWSITEKYNIHIADTTIADFLKMRPYFTFVYSYVITIKEF